MQTTSDRIASTSVAGAAERAKRASRLLARLEPRVRTDALARVAASLADNEARILEANAVDLDAARPLVESGALAEPLFRRLKLDPAKVRDLVTGVEQVASLEDPLGVVTLATELDDGLELRRIACPIGVVGVVFESRPDALTQIASLCLKSGNAVILKGGREAEHTNRTLFEIIREASVAAGIPEGALALLAGREDVAALLGAHDSVDLIVPRGSNALVRYVQENTLIPVLGHAEGICHVYVDAAANLERAVEIVVDAKITYPAACNAVETVLVHHGVAPSFLPAVIAKLVTAGVEVRCDSRSASLAGTARIARASDADWDSEYCDLVVSVRVVDSLDEAISHINGHGSRHTDAIVTDDDSAWERFFAEVDSAGVFRNASTRFADGFRYGFGAELGISTGKLHPRGPVGVEGLVTYKYQLVGHGHLVADYSGDGAKPFTHRPISRSRE